MQFPRSSALQDEHTKCGLREQLQTTAQGQYDNDYADGGDGTAGAHDHETT